MNKLIYFPLNVMAAVLIFAASISLAIARDRTNTDLAKSLVGTWRIVSDVAVDRDTKEVSYPYGKHPGGYLQYSPGGHMMAVLSDGDMKKAKPPFSDAEKLGFYNTLAAYCGTYTIEGNTVTHHVVAAYRPDWVGSGQVRHVELHGKTLTIRSASISAATGKRIASTLTWEREE